MPPKAKITREEIINTALELVRISGEDAINARAIAGALNCSTQPIFSNFDSMEQLDDAVKQAAFDKYLKALEQEAKSGKYPPYKAYGMAYIQFAKDERELFKMIFMCDRRGAELKLTDDFNASVDMIMKANGISREKAALLHLEMWTCVHGIATIVATNYLELDFGLISDMLTDVYQGVRARIVREE